MINRINANSARRARWARIFNRETFAQRQQRRVENYLWKQLVIRAHRKAASEGVS